jgi:hypothetical protein
MRRALPVLVTTLAWLPLGAHAATLDVCSSCTYTTVTDAVAAAVDGDVIDVGAGTWAESVVLSHSVTLQGAGAGSTFLSGAGPASPSLSATSP